MEKRPELKAPVKQVDAKHTETKRDARRSAQHNEGEEGEETPLDAAAAIASMAATQALSNQETEKVAMVDDLMNASPPHNTTNTATTPRAPTISTEIAGEILPQVVAAPTPAAAGASAARFAVPVTPAAAGSSGGGGGGSGSNNTSLKKKRHKIAKKRQENEARSNCGSFVGAASGSRIRRDEASHANAAAATAAATPTIVTSNIKTSLSMTSLPPDEKQESRDVIKAKLRVERPYNSLKKNTDRSNSLSIANHFGNMANFGNANFAHSHSSSSLGLGSGKDDLWAAIQTNYNYIMDTNLLDSCKEARCEIEGAASVMEHPIERCFKMLDETQRSEGLCDDPKELRKWLREKEHKLENAPSIHQATMFTIAELQHSLAEFSVLYHEIVAHARVVNACVRAATEREQKQQQLLLEQQQQPQSLGEQTNSSLSSIEEPTLAAAATSSESSLTDTIDGSKSPITSASTRSASGSGSAKATASSKKSEGSVVERLQNRYYLLYLKAFEIQLWLDNLLRKKSSSANILDDSDEDVDDSSDCADEDDDRAATEDDLNNVASDLESDITNHSASYCNLQHCHADELDNACTAQLHDCAASKGDCEDGDDEEEDEDEVDFASSHRDWPNLGYSAVLVTYDKSGASGTGALRNSGTTTLTDFEADSESSDFETAQNSRRQRRIGDLRYINQLQQKAVPSQRTPTPPESDATAASIAHANNHVAAALSADNGMSHVTATSTPMKSPTNMNAAVGVGGKSAANPPAATAAPGSASAATQTSPKLQLLHSNNASSKHATTPIKQKSIAVISPNSHNGGLSGVGTKSPPVLRKHRQQQRHADISKFNRSNRKSKNCAIFYFKHLDTDNETTYSGGTGTGVGGEDPRGGGSGGLSSSGSQASDPLKSADASSDDDGGWLYSSATVQAQQQSAIASDLNGSGGSLIVVDGLQSPMVSASTSTTSHATTGDDSDKENKEVLAAAAAAAAVSTAATAHSRGNLTQSALHSATQISIAEVQLAADTGAQATPPQTAFVTNNSSNNSSLNSSISSGGSSYSSTDLLTETTTSATTTTQVTQMHHQLVRRAEMDLQIGAGNGNSRSTNNNKSIEISNNANNNNNQPLQPQQPQQRTEMKQQLADSNGNPTKDKMCFYTRADICNISVKPSVDLHSSSGRRLPPRSPTKLNNSLKSNGSDNSISTTSPTKGKVSHESIKQLVLEAEHLVRDEALKTPSKQKHSMVKISSTVKKREVSMPGPTKQRVQEWLAHQPATPPQLHKPHDLLSGFSANGTRSTNADGCEASGEASETDSIPQPGSDTSEGFTDSIATCMQTSTNSYGGNSTERIGGSAEPIIGGSNAATTPLSYGSSNQSLNMKIVKRPQGGARRKSDRPWSVSCLSQLTTDTTQVSSKVVAVSNVQAGLATHSISESALDSLSPSRPRASSSSATHVAHVKNYCDSKGSLKRRKTRKKKHSLTTTITHSTGKKTTDSGSEETAEMPRLTQTQLMKSCESMSPAQRQEIAAALLNLQKTTAASAEQLSSSANAAQQALAQQQLLPGNQDSSEEATLMKPNFRVGSYTSAYMRNEKRLGSLAALAYMNEDEQQGEYTTGTEDHHSSFSETAWDNYQEKYNSENYSEGFDSDAARRLMEFGDDYRNFIDSQSDCCSSLSAANNVDSLSPPRMDSLQQNETKIITQDTIASSVDHARRRRALELEYERRRKTLEVRRKSCQDSSDNQNTRSPTISLSSSANALTPKNADKCNFQHRTDSASRKLEFGMSHSAQSLRRTSESDTSTRRRKADERRRSSRNLEKCIKVIPATSSSSGDDSDEEKEMRNLLQQSHSRLEDTRALKIRCHLLRPEDYAEIINTCRDNIRCLEAVLRGPPGTVLSTQCVSNTKDLLAAWEDLLGWSENAAAARKLQEEMIILKHALNRLGNKSSFELLDTEPAIQVAVEALKSEKSQLQNYRTNMLRLNASVHSWLTRQERKLQAALAEQQLREAAAKVTAELAVERRQVECEQLQSVETATTTMETTTTVVSNAATTITVTDSNGNQLETYATVAAAAAVSGATQTSTASTSTSTATTATEKVWDLHTLMSSENEFHKHLKDEVSDMYSAWDEADARINTQLEVLTNSLIAWRQLECGLSEFQLALGQDRGTLKGLEGALDKGQATPVELAQNVKLVAKLLSEKVNVSQEQLTAVQEHLDPNHILHIAKFTASNGSLSDSGISDGGTTSDGGLSERERRLGVLRRLAKQLESALAPGSEAMKSIAARMESAEAELKNLQNTCRDLIVRTAATHQNKKLQQQQQLEAQQKRQNEEAEAVVATKAAANGFLKTNGHNGCKKAVHQQQKPDAEQEQAQPPQQQQSPSKRKNKRRQRKNSSGSQASADAGGSGAEQAGSVRLVAAGAPDSGDPFADPSLEFDLDDKSRKRAKNGWAWRIAKAAAPVQLALFAFLCAACLMQPNCCDNLNNLSMSFTPQLRYIRGPPPI